MELGTWQDLKNAFANTTGIDRTDLTQVHYKARERQNISAST